MSAKVKDIQMFELKDTISQLNEQLRIQNGLLASLKDELEKSRKALEEKDRLIANLQEQLAYMKQKMFGSSSEKHSGIPGQMSLFETFVEEGGQSSPVQEPDNPVESIEGEFIELPPKVKKTRKPKTKFSDQFNLLPVRKVFEDTFSEEEKLCPICGAEMEVIGHEYLRTEITYTPAAYERVEVYGTTYGCRDCKESGEKASIKKDNGRGALIPHSYVSESLAAKIMYDKFGVALPLYRQEKLLADAGVPISRTTMASAVIFCAEEYLQPLYDYFHRELLKRRFLMSDETPIQVLKEPDRRPQSKSYIWMIRSGEDRLPPIILYHYTMTRAGDNAAEFLSGAEDGYYYMSDGYGGYNKLKGGKRCACWAHIRRYLYEAIPKGHEKDLTEPALQGVLYCDKLFEYERRYKEKGLDYKQVHKRRLKDEAPVIDAFLRWADSQKPVKGSRLDRALTYIHNQAKYMRTYLEDGRCSLSNNLSENSIRPVVVGRKNWLFSDTQAGANASMIIYTIIEMAKAHGLNPYKYLEYLLHIRLTKDSGDEDFRKAVPWDPDVQTACKAGSK